MTFDIQNFRNLCYDFLMLKRLENSSREDLKQQNEYIQKLKETIEQCKEQIFMAQAENLPGLKAFSIERVTKIINLSIALHKTKELQEKDSIHLKKIEELSHRFYLKLIEKRGSVRRIMIWQPL